MTAALLLCCHQKHAQGIPKTPFILSDVYSAMTRCLEYGRDEPNQKRRAQWEEAYRRLENLTPND